MSKFGIIVKNKISEAKKKKAFTLVELIIVITILAVLAAIAFLNLNGYTWDARDSVRVSDLKNIQKTMELSLGEWNLLPIPDELKTEKIELQELPWVKWQEWLFWDESIKELRDLSQVPLDPKTKSKYRYLVSENRQNYYLEVELENWSKYILTNYGNALALNSAPNAPKTPWNPGGTTTPPPATPQTQDKDKYHPIWQTINAIVWAQVNPSDWIQNKQDLPSTTVYRWKNGTPGENSWTIEVVYPDSSITEITVTINYSCATWHTKVWSECKANTQACAIVNGNWTQALQPNGTYGTCTASTCNANFHKEWNECVSNTRECTISSGAGSRVSSWELQLRGRSIESGTRYLLSGGAISRWSTAQTTKKWIQTWDTKTNSWWTCVEVNSKPTVSWVTWETTVAVWQQLNLTINGTDSDWDALTYKSTNLPSGLTISWNKIIWTRNTAWEVTFQVVASDGKVDSDPINIKVDFLLVGEMRLTYSWMKNWDYITLPYHWNVKIISINWWDNWVNNCITKANYDSPSCHYNNASKWTYTIIVKWSANWFWREWSWNNKLINITDWNKMWITDLSYAFYWAENFNQPLNGFDTSKITNMKWMFHSAKNFNQPLSNWNTWKVTDMSYMFAYAQKFNQNINNWNTSNVVSMKDMFTSYSNDGYYSSFNQPLSNWNVSKVKDMSSMFSNLIYFNQNINNWNVSNVEDMSSMFSWAKSFNQPLNNWNTWKVTNMYSMFKWIWAYWNSSSFNQDINSWDVSNVTNMSDMFYRATSFNKPLNNWNTWKVINMSNMFSWATSFNQNINNWNVSNVTDMSSMFYWATGFNQPLSNWNTWKVINMRNMFYEASIFDQNINSWNVSNVTDMSYMFFKASSFDKPLNNWNTWKVTNMSGMFRSASSFDQPLSNWNVSNVTDMSGMFEASAFNQNIDNWNVSNVTNMKNMFSYNQRFNQPLNSWNVSNVINMMWMFTWATNFNQPLNNWNMLNVTTISWRYNSYSTSSDWMFERATSFKQDISSWTLPKVDYCGPHFAASLTRAQKPPKCR